MDNLRRNRCFNHQSREAVARCPGCNNDFCRECITEHGGKMLCVNCLRAIVERRAGKVRFFQRVVLFFGLMVSFWLCYLFFCWTGELLGSIPDKFHDTFYHDITGK